MLALVLKRSSRVMPGLRGTPAGTTITSQPLRAASRFSAPVWIRVDRQTDRQTDAEVWGGAVCVRMEMNLAWAPNDCMQQLMVMAVVIVMR
jgi:hypothetical protein